MLQGEMSKTDLVGFGQNLSVGCCRLAVVGWPLSVGGDAAGRDGRIRRMGGGHGQNRVGRVRTGGSPVRATWARRGRKRRDRVEGYYVAITADLVGVFIDGAA